MNKLKMNKLSYSEQAANGKRWCYDCDHYSTLCFCGYNQHHCNIYGSLDMDQIKRHPDKTADTCKDYKTSNREPWYTKYERAEG